MDKRADETRTGESAMDRMMRFGRAIFAVPKDELPNRDERDDRGKRSKKKPNAAPDA